MVEYFRMKFYLIRLGTLIHSLEIFLDPGSSIFMHKLLLSSLSSTDFFRISLVTILYWVRLQLESCGESIETSIKVEMDRSWRSYNVSRFSPICKPSSLLRWAVILVYYKIYTSISAPVCCNTHVASKLHIPVFSTMWNGTYEDYLRKLKDFFLTWNFLWALVNFCVKKKNNMYVTFKLPKH